jgi:hypothetical protein
MLSHEAAGTVGIEGHIRVIKHDVSGLKGSGPNGEVEFDDLWNIDGGGRLRSRYPERLTEDRTIKNKVTRRGLNYFMFQNMRGLSGSEQTKQTSELTYPPTGSINPFAAFVLIGDDGAVPTRRGDAQVLWDESDGTYDDKVPAGSGTAVYGRRGLVISTQTTGIFKRVQIRYPNSSPNYEELEYTFFAQANTVPQDGPTGGDLGLDNFVCKALALAAGVACGWNEANSQVGIRAVLGLAGTQQGLSDRVYVHENYVYGDGSASGLGSVTPLHRFTGVETIDTRDGYVASTETADTTLGSLTAHASSAFTIKASGNIIKFGNAVADLGGSGFTTAYIRKTLIVANTTSNNGDFTIKRIVSTTEVEVFETVVTEATPTTATATLVTRYTGDKAFDSRVENEGIVDKATFDVDTPGAVIAGEKFASTDVPGPHYVARIWPKLSAKQIRGIRITFPKGSIRDFCPDKFTIKYLNSTHGGSGDPRPADLTDWITVPGQDYSAVSQAAYIFDNGEYGYEYHFASATPATCGIGIFGVVGVDTARKIEVATVYAYTAPASVSITSGFNDALKLSIDAGVHYKTFLCPAVPATTSVQTICDALNRVLYGWGLECVRSTFGYFWLRATVGGSYSSMMLDVVPNSIYGTLFPGVTISGPTTRTGFTQSLTKLNTDALTFIYTPRMAGNLPKP